MSEPKKTTMASLPRYVTIACVEVAETLTKDLGNKKTGKVKKLLPSATHTLCVAEDSETRELKTNVSREEFQALFPKKDYEEFFTDLTLTLGASDVRLDLSSPYNQMVYKAICLGRTDKIARKKEEANSAVHYWYLKDEEAEASSKLTEFQMRKKAYDLFDKMSDEEKSKMLKAYGVPTRSINIETQKAKLLDLLENNPSDFVRRTEDPNLELISFLYTALEIGLPNFREERGHYYWGEIYLGPSIPAAAVKMSDPLNQDTLLQMRTEYQYKVG